MSLCVVFVCNKNYFEKFLTTCHQLVTNGKYTGPICLVIGDDLLNSSFLDHPIIKKNNIIIKYFPTIQFSESFLDLQKKLERGEHWFRKIFQFHKFHLFNTYFKQWDTIFYIDCGITILSDIGPILSQKTPNTIVAHSDAYPTFVWKLNHQFDKNTEIFTKLDKTFNLNIDYFQTTIMLYDTKIIEQDTYDNLLKLLMEYPISNTNDQGIIALYFTNIKPLYKPLITQYANTHTYDYYPRNMENRYIMLKILLV